MSIDNLDIVKRLIAEKECGRVEFKETTGQLERGMETLCAFLNGEGGTVLFGVTDKGKIIGQDVSDKTKRDIADAVWRIEPFATVEVSPYERRKMHIGYELKGKYLKFITCLLHKPDLPVRTVLKTLFRKNQVRGISEKYGINLNCQIVSLSANQWKCCFMEMLDKVPEKYHPT